MINPFVLIASILAAIGAIVWGRAEMLSQKKRDEQASEDIRRFVKESEEAIRRTHKEHEGRLHGH